MRQLVACLAFPVAKLVATAGIARAQRNGVCAANCGNRCYNASNRSCCESSGIAGCSAGGGQTPAQQSLLPPMPLFSAPATTPDFRSWGWAYHMGSNEPAEAAAMSQCEKQGRGKCLGSGAPSEDACSSSRKSDQAENPWGRRKHSPHHAVRFRDRKMNY